MYASQVLYEKERRMKDDEIQFLQQFVSHLPRTQRYVCEHSCELLGVINESACLLWGLQLLWPFYPANTDKLQLSTK